MNRILGISIVAIGILLISSCAAPKSLMTGMYKQHWLIGSWKDKKGHTTLEWKFVNKNVMLGRMYNAVSRDTIVVETIKMERKNKEVLYHSTLLGTNNVDINCKLKSEVGNTIDFVNTVDGFPKNITYILKADGTLTQIIEGTESSGDYKKREFSFTKAVVSTNKQ
jgi:hypothetical protein